MFDTCCYRFALDFFLIQMPCMTGWVEEFRNDFQPGGPFFSCSDSHTFQPMRFRVFGQHPLSTFFFNLLLRCRRMQPARVPPWGFTDTFQEHPDSVGSHLERLQDVLNRPCSNAPAGTRLSRPPLRHEIVLAPQRTVSFLWLGPRRGPFPVAGGGGGYRIPLDVTLEVCT